METTLWIILIHVIELIAIAVYFIIRKNIKLENALKQQQQYIDTLGILFSRLNDSLMKIDEKVWVDGDSELSGIFTEINSVKKSLDELYN
jgi:hypothetical protein